MLGIWVSYLIFVHGRGRAALLVRWGCCADWIDVVDFWVRSPSQLMGLCTT
jgi:hypothetical protein